LCETRVAIELRIPVIPGITDADGNMAALGRFVASLPRKPPVKLLPYHRAAMDKYGRFGMDAPLPNTPEPTAADMNACRVMFDVGKRERERGGNDE